MCFLGLVQVRSLGAEVCTYQSPSAALLQPLARQEPSWGQKHQGDLIVIDNGKKTH